MLHGFEASPRHGTSSQVTQSELCAHITYNTRYVHMERCVIGGSVYFVFPWGRPAGALVAVVF